MSELIQIEMTLEEARETDRLIKRHINTTRYLLLDMRDRKGWKALGYESFGDYGKKSLGYEKAYLTQLADAGEISIQLGYDAEFAMANSAPSERQLRPLKSVPESVRQAIWDEATRKAEEEHAKLTAKRVEEAVAEWKRRSEEFRAESNERRKKIRDMETEIDLLKATEPEVRVVEKPVIPADYEAIKTRALELDQEIKTLKKKHSALVQQKVVAKLREREKEIADLDRQAKEAEARLASLNKQIDSYSSTERMTRLQRELIEKTRSALVDLASHFESLPPLENDPETARLWDALADMLRNAAMAVDCFRGRAHPGLPAIRASANLQ